MCHTCATQTVQHLNPGKHCSDCKWRNYPLQSPHSSPAAHTNHIILILLSPEFLGPDLCLCGSSALSSHLPVVTYISKKLFLLSSCLFLVLFFFSPPFASFLLTELILTITISQSHPPGRLFSHLILSAAQLKLLYSLSNIIYSLFNFQIPC